MKRSFYLLVAASLLLAGCGEDPAELSKSRSWHDTRMEVFPNVLNLEVGEYYQLVLDFDASWVHDVDVFWYSDNPAVAWVNDRGTVTANAEGVATITATTVDGDKTASCEVRVNEIVYQSSGATGNLTWELTDEGATLTISGKGGMPDYRSLVPPDNRLHRLTTDAPWFTQKGNITKIVIENGVTSIGSYAFTDHDSLVSVTIPESVRKIGSEAFYNCQNLADVVFADRVSEGATIDQHAFAWCPGLESISIPNGMTKIEAYAFTGCENLAGIVIPGSVQILGEGVFAKCYSLTDIGVDAENSSFSSENGILFNKDRTVFVAYPSVKGDYDMPEGVRRLVKGAFWDCAYMTGLTIPGSLTELSSDSFSGCTILERINVAVGNPTFSSKEGVLFDKNGTILLGYPEGKSGHYTIPEGVTGIGDFTFGYCDGLTGITFPNSLKTIGDGVFQSCNSLISLIIPDGVRTIGDGSFYGCNNLADVTLGSGLTTVGSQAFDQAAKLLKVTIRAIEPPYIRRNYFDNCLYNFIASGDTLYVPEGCGDPYRNSYWGVAFTRIVEQGQ